jgi:hypothetical protein
MILSGRRFAPVKVSGEVLSLRMRVYLGKRWSDSGNEEAIATLNSVSHLASHTLQSHSVDALEKCMVSR